MEKWVEDCDIPKCADRVWLSILLAFSVIVILVGGILGFLTMKRIRKRGMTDIQNVKTVQELVVDDILLTVSFFRRLIYRTPIRIFMEIHD